MSSDLRKSQQHSIELGKPVAQNESKDGPVSMSSAGSPINSPVSIRSGKSLKSSPKVDESLRQSKGTKNSPKEKESKNINIFKNILRKSSRAKEERNNNNNAMGSSDEQLSLYKARKEAKSKRITQPNKTREALRQISYDAFALPPDTSFSEDQIDQFIIRMIDPKDGIPIGTHRKKFKTYYNCFSGEECTKWIQNALHVDKETAIQHGQTIFMNRGVFFSISRKHISFHAKPTVFYRFRMLDDEDTSVLNTAKICLTEPTNACQLSQDLADMMIKLLLIPHKKENFKAIRKTRMFKKFVLMTTTLQKIKWDSMEEAQKRVFLINVYNVLFVHACISCGMPKNDNDLALLMTSKCYKIAGTIFSLQSLHDIVTGDLPRELPEDFPREQLSIALDPLVHFCLFNATSQSPSIRAYTLEDFDEMASQQTKQFCAQFIEFDKENMKVTLPKAFETYQQHFGKREDKVLRRIADHLPKADREWLKGAADKVEVLYQDYGFDNVNFIKESVY